MSLGPRAPDQLGYHDYCMIYWLPVPEARNLRKGVSQAGSFWGYGADLSRLPLLLVASGVPCLVDVFLLYLHISSFYVCLCVQMSPSF